MRCGSASSSFAALSYQLEEARTKQLKERSKRALELMKAAVEWKSWDELQTLSKAFQGYLEEIRETDLCRKTDLETSISRVWAARGQLAKADRHKDEAKMQAELIHASNVDLRHQLEFDARQFVALLQSCAHLERQLATLRQKCIEEADQTPPKAESHDATGCTSRSAPQRGAFPAEPVTCATHVQLTLGPRDVCGKVMLSKDRCSSNFAEAVSSPAAGPSQSEGIAQVSAEAEQAATEEAAATVFAAVAAAETAIDEEEQSPAGMQPSEASTALELSPEQKNPPSREDSNGRKEALLVLSALADLKKKLQLCSAARDTSISTCDGTPALMEPASPGNAQAEDTEDVVSTVETPPHSSAGPSPGATLEDLLRSGNQEYASPARRLFCEATKAGGEDLPCLDPPSPNLRPSVLAAEEALRWATMRDGAQANARLLAGMTRAEDCFGEIGAHSKSQTSQQRHVVQTAKQPVASFFSAVAHGGTTFAPTLSTSSVSSSRSVPAGASELDRTLRLMSRSSGPVVSRTLRGALGPLHSEAQGSPASSTSGPGQCAGSPEKLQQQGVAVSPSAVPSLPMRSALPATGTVSARGQRNAGGQGEAPEGRADAAYVATVQLVKELGKVKVSSATSQKQKSLQKEVSQSGASRATCRERPMDRERSSSPSRRSRRSEAQDQSTKASL
ncbi:unnamed protein product [Durusdinium trenchii]|uniref:Uncharacterized protein n=1 Tax=Durusdinium trenchii TaxID=1381693 RepID=A0ABP0Q5K9_9DINO